MAEKAAQLARDARPHDHQWQELARLTGLLHDLGKYRCEFQQHLAGGPDAPHAIYGACAGKQARMVEAAFAIAGHHAGLHDLVKLRGALEQHLHDLAVLLERATTDGISLPTPIATTAASKSSGELRTRMLFSVLVDADRLMSELHDVGVERAPGELDAPRCLERLLAHVNELSRKPALTTAERALQDRRREILEACLKSSASEPGLFSLTVPTGGGKTFSGMAFALAHAARHGLRRVVVAIPFLSIIEQNAAAYEDVFGHGVVLEHHSGVEPAQAPGAREDRSLAEAATENWDAPIIVTTTVQLVETLFAAHPSRARRLHNLARSVLLLDEVQTLPGHLLNPLVDVLAELSRSWGTTIVLASATQPGFVRSSGLPAGFAPGAVREIAPEPLRTFQALRRVSYQIDPPARVVGWDELAAEIVRERSVLCVVNLRRHAAELWQAVSRLLPDSERDSLFHLSSLMCPQHRLDRLGDARAPEPGSIRRRLLDGLPCRVVSTQVVEAGVDVDFPVVLRALGPLDAIVQAAGRCNREGHLTDALGLPRHGRVRVFRPNHEWSTPKGAYSIATQLTASVLEEAGAEALASDPRMFCRYFERLWRYADTDRHGEGQQPLQAERESFNFRTVAERARVIEQDTIPVAVPWGRGPKLIASMLGAGLVTRHELRSLQRSLVNVPRGPQLDEAIANGLLAPLVPALDLLYTVSPQSYCEHRGLRLEHLPCEAFVI